MKIENVCFQIRSTRWKSREYCEKNTEGDENVDKDVKKKKAIESSDIPKLNITAYADSKNQIEEHTHIEIKWQAYRSKKLKTSLPIGRIAF